MHPDRRRIQALEDVHDQPFVQAALDGESGTVTADIEGVKTLVSYAPVERLGWVVLIHEPVRTAYAAIYQSTLLSTGLVGVSLTAAVLIA